MTKIIELCSTTNWFEQIPPKFLRVTSGALYIVTPDLLRCEELEKYEFLYVIELLSRVNEYLLNLLYNNIQLTYKDLEDKDYGLGAESIGLCYYIVEKVPQFIELNISKDNRYKKLKENAIHIDSVKNNAILNINDPEEAYTSYLLQKLISIKVFNVIIAALK